MKKNQQNTSFFVVFGRYGQVFLISLIFALLEIGGGQEADNKQLQEVAALGLQSCVDGFVVHRDKIIRTQDSREMGAKYLTEFDVESRIECMRACCETPHCDVFIFEEKKPGSCYLFHCGPPHDFKCKFTSHANYSSAVLTDYNLQNAVALEEEIRRNQQEHELKSLRKSEPPAKEYNYFSNPPATTPSTPAPPPPSTTSTTTAPVKAPACSRNQFECRSGDDCIAIYNVCDGIPQCADGSDEATELGCPVDRATQPPPPPPPPPALVPSPKSYNLPLLPDVLRYQQMMQQQQQQVQHLQYPMMYPGGHGMEQGKVWPMPNNPNLGQIPNLPEMNYPGREYGSPIQQVQQQQQQQQQLQQQQPPQSQQPSIEDSGGIPQAGMAQQLQQQQGQLPNVNYDKIITQQQPGYQWNQAGGYQSSIYVEPNANNNNNNNNNNNKFTDRTAIDVMHAIPQSVYEQEQMPRIFNHKGPGIRLEDMEVANGVYGQDPNRVYAPYYPHMMHHENSWQDANRMQVQAPVPTPAPPHEQPNPEAQMPRTTSTPPPPCDTSDKQEDTGNVKNNDSKKTDTGVGQKTSQSAVVKNHNDPSPDEVESQKPMPASVVKSDIHKVHELEVRMPDSHLQQHKGMAIAEHMRRHGPSVEELEMTRPKGAVISLALGLTVTAIMAVLIACRMRVVKRRGRGRGHDSYAQDADYLVNGMYL